MTDASGASSSSKREGVFQPKPEYSLLSQGAEARIWKIPAAADGSNPAMIAKERFSKAYRHPVLDEKLTKTRCRAEARLLEKCRNQKDSTKCIDVPQVIRMEAPVLFLEFIEGITVREYLEEKILISFENEECSKGNGEKAYADGSELTVLAGQMGTMIGKLHNMGIVHGDLTTSNMMLREEHKRVKLDSDGDAVHSKMTLIDFGLAKSTTSAEERAVDLYVLERALSSTHPKLPLTFFESILGSYKAQIENKADATIQRLEQVRLRGRKRECFG